jgi:hypothetical protein
MARKILKETSDNYAAKIMGSSLSKEEALSSYLLYFIPRIAFLLPVLSSSEKQCKEIHPHHSW